MGNLSHPMLGWPTRRQAAARPSGLIGVDEFQLVIPWPVALQQSRPPLHQLGSTLPCSAEGKQPVRLHCAPIPDGLFTAQAATGQARGLAASMELNVKKVPRGQS